MIADHSTVLANLQVSNPPPPFPPHTARKIGSLCKIKSADSEKFEQDLSEKLSNLNLPIDVFAFSLFGESISTALDKHAPLQEKIISIRPKMLRYTTEVLEARREKRQAERKWKATNREEDKKLFKSKRNQHCHKIKIDKANYFKPGLRSTQQQWPKEVIPGAGSAPPSKNRPKCCHPSLKQKT